MSFRIIDQARTFFGLTGELLPGGYLVFYDAGTTDLRDVYGDMALSVNNGSTIGLDASGRPEHDIWGAGDYRYRVYDADDVEQADVDDVIDPTAAGLTLPEGDAGQFLTTDGVGGYSFVDISQVPSMTGQANKFLKTDGTAALWATGPAAGADANVEVTATTLEADDGTDFFLMQRGSDTAPNVGGRTTSKAVVFTTAYDAAPFVGITPTGSTYSSFGNQPSWTLSAISATGFTVKFTLGELDDSQSGFDFNATVPFDWIAFGVKP